MFLFENAEFTLIANRNSFDRAILTIEGDFSQVEYIITCQDVQQSQPFNYEATAKAVIRLVLIGLAYWAVRSIYRWVLPEKNEEGS